MNRVLSLEGQVDDVVNEAVAEQHIQLLAVAMPQVRAQSRGRAVARARGQAIPSHAQRRQLGQLVLG